MVKESKNQVEVSIDSPKIVYKMTKLHLMNWSIPREELADLLV